MSGGRGRPTVIIGGAGFIGSNLADRLLSKGRAVRILDDLSRLGSGDNLRWLSGRHGDRLEVHVGDVRDQVAVRAALAGASAVFHLAAQVAVTSSLRDPVTDFEVNLGGTLNLLEELRRIEPVPLVFTSTNKVYGELRGLALRASERRYEPVHAILRARGIDERVPLEFGSPYGCSKGGADQYVLDYARTFGLPAVVLRMSCIYGPRQFGTEDQGWVAHFLLRAIEGQALTLFGDGRQVRDLLYIADLLDALELAGDRAGELAGEAYNIGGGPDNALSLLELIALAGELLGGPPAFRFADWRAGDQRYYVTDNGKFRRATGWVPRVGVRAGAAALFEWLRREQARRQADSSAGAMGELG